MVALKFDQLLQYHTNETRLWDRPVCAVQPRIHDPHNDRPLSADELDEPN